MIVVFSTFVQYSVISFRNLFLEENNLTKQIAQGHLDGIHCLPILIGRGCFMWKAGLIIFFKKSLT